MTYTWDLNPIALSVMGLEVRWYGLAYVGGYFLAVYLSWWLWQNYQSKNFPKLKILRPDFENFIFSTFLVGVISARLGLFLFYSPTTFFTDPLEVLKVWHGGMSIHGGLIGASLWGIWQAKKRSWPLLPITDLFMLPLALGLMFGRITNFINGELYGRATDQTWGVIFPHIDALLRHPSQLYEASKNLLIAVIIFILIRSGGLKKPGLVTSVMLFGYGVFRFLIEFVREPSGYIGPLTTGQALCLIMIILALGLTHSQKYWKNKT